MPLGESMITSLRSNKRKEVNVAYFKNKATTIKDKQKSNFDHKKASPELIHKIKTKMQRKRKARNKKLLYIGFIISAAIAIIMWLLIEYRII